MWVSGVLFIVALVWCVHGANIQIMDEWTGRVHISVNENPTVEVNGWEIILISNVPLGKIDVSMCLLMR